MKAMPRTIIFGAGEGGRRARRFLGRTARVVGYLDNDQGKHGTMLDGLPVHAPAALPSLEWDRILIASMHHEAIFQQLVQSGIPMGTIDVLDQAVLFGDDELPWGCWTLLGALLIVAMACAGFILFG